MSRGREPMAWSAADDMLASWELEEDLEKLWLELGVSEFVILVDVVYARSDQSGASTTDRAVTC